VPVVLPLVQAVRVDIALLRTILVVQPKTIRKYQKKREIGKLVYWVMYILYINSLSGPAFSGALRLRLDFLYNRLTPLLGFQLIFFEFF
jgi:hypothetical protein